MPRLLAALATTSVLVAAAPAAAAPVVALPGRPAELVGLAAAGRDAVALLDEGEPRGPLTVIRSDGRRTDRVASAGASNAEFPMLAADATGRIVVGWSHPISGAAMFSIEAVPSGARMNPHTGTGPGRLAIDSRGAAVIAYPDETGDIAVTTTPGVARPSRAGEEEAEAGTVTLTSDAPAHRHFAAGLALRKAGPLVLDLVQRRGRSELRVVGPGAPKAPLIAVKGLRQLEGAIAAAEDRIAVAYVQRRRIVLATARPGGSWRRRTLRSAAVSGAPSVVLDGARAHVAWSQRGDVHLATAGSGTAYRQVTRTRAKDGPPRLAAGTGGRVFAGWTTAGRTRLTRLR